MGSGNNTAMIRDAASRLPCQVGGGMRSIGAVEAALAAGARKVIVGSALFARGHLDWSFASKLAAAVGSDRLVFALDARGGRVVIHGWRTITEIKPLEMIQALDRWSGAFLYTHVDTEGSLQGFPQKVLQPLRKATSRQLIAAGGIRSKAEVDALHAMGVDAVVGMAIYTGLMPA
jgi:phosphoribosylformimino-5-aminoimidazole carboxamide ribotide isomerase